MGKVDFESLPPPLNKGDQGIERKLFFALWMWRTRSPQGVGGGDDSLSLCLFSSTHFFLHNFSSITPLEFTWPCHIIRYNESYVRPRLSSSSLTVFCCCCCGAAQCCISCQCKALSLYFSLACMCMCLILLGGFNQLVKTRHFSRPPS